MNRFVFGALLVSVLVSPLIGRWLRSRREAFEAVTTWPEDELFIDDRALWEDLT